MNNSHLHLNQLARQLREPRQTGSASPICNNCQNEIHLFVSDELAGCRVDELYPEIAYHLDTCPVCLHKYVKLAHLTALALFGEEIV